MKKLSRTDIVFIRQNIARVIGTKREYEFWHEIVLKTPEHEFILIDED